MALPTSIQVRVASGINVVIGVVLASSPWWQTHEATDTGVTMASVLIGSLIALCGAGRVLYPHRLTAMSGANIAFGIWTAISPWAFGYEADLARIWLSLLAGVAVATFGTWSIGATFSEQRLSS